MAAPDEPVTNFNPNDADNDPDDATVPTTQSVLNASVSGNDTGPEPDGTGSIGAGEKIGGGGGAMGEAGSAADTNPAGGAGTGNTGAASSGGASGGGTAGGTASTGAGAISDPA